MRTADENDEDEEKELLVDKPQSPDPGILRPLAFLQRIPSSVLLGAGICAMLSVQNSAYTLLRRYSSGVLREPASSQSILAVGEILKLMFSISMIAREQSASVKATGRLQWLAQSSYRLLFSSAEMAVPALIFLAMNLLSFVSLHRISASAFTLIQQSKLIFTAVLSRLLLNKVLSLQRWRALLSLLFAVLTICHQTSPMRKPACGPSGEQPHELREYVVGVAAVALEALLSGLSNVYFEKVLKSTSLTLWERNVQLAGYSLLIYVPMAFSENPHQPLHGWSPLTWLVATLGALGGILIGLVLKYCDSIIKNLALSTAIITTAVIDFTAFDGPMNLPIVAAAGSIVIAIVNYTDSG